MSHDTMRASRRGLFGLGLSVMAGAGLAATTKPALAAQRRGAVGAARADQFVTGAGVRLHVKDWGQGPPVVFCHGWPLSADAWEDQMMALSAAGFRTVAHDRRGHGRSSQTYDGNDMDHYADDLAELIEALDLHDITLVGHSAGGGEAVRYLSRHGQGRVARLALISAVTPKMVQDHGNPNAIPPEVFDGLRASLVADRSQLYHSLSETFYGANRPASAVSQGVKDAFWLQGMAGGLKPQIDSTHAFSETDFRPDLARISVPTLVVHGDDDQIVPIAVGGQRTSAQIRGAVLKVYAGAPHGLPTTHKIKLNEDLLAFIRGG